MRINFSDRALGGDQMQRGCEEERFQADIAATGYPIGDFIQLFLAGAHTLQFDESFT
jgi:hypothetical protein